jgi:hypothetical protein
LARIRNRTPTPSSTDASKGEARLCALCGLPSELKDSHFLPAGFYRLLSDQSAPVIISPAGAAMSSAQARAHLLCDKCEQRFNRGGEDWVLRHAWHSSSNFPLHAALSASVPFVDDQEFRAFNSREIGSIDTDRIVYFALSMFWRASVHSWAIGKTRTARLVLGPFCEALKQYLLEPDGMPDGIVVLVHVNRALDEMHNKVAALPFPLNRSSVFRSYKFLAMGISCVMMVGSKLPPDALAICSGRTGYLYQSDRNDSGTVESMAHVVGRARVRGELASKWRRRRLATN